MVSKIDELNLTFKQYEEKSHSSAYEKKELIEKQERNKNAGARLELANRKLE